MKASSPNVARQSNQASNWAPRIGAAMGTMLKTIIMRASMRAACSWVQRSLTMVRERTGPLDIPRPCTKRQKTTAPIDSADMHAKVATR